MLLGLSFRQIYILGFIACASLLGAAYYFEYALYLDPCPLCIMQRIAVLLLALVFLVGALHNPLTVLSRRIYCSLGLLAGLFGSGLAGRHVWIQNLPADEVPTCGPSLEYMVDALPIAELIGVMLRGNGNCAEAVWSFLGLSMPQWTLVWFVGFTVGGIYLIYLVGKDPKSEIRHSNA